MAEITRILAAIEQGDPTAPDQLLPMVYEELRKLASTKMAREDPGQTLQATALVHEAYIRLVGNEPSQQWNSRGHFFGAAAEAMRRILIENARQKNGPTAGGQRRRIDLSAVAPEIQGPNLDLIALNDAIEELSEEDSRAAKLVKLRFFAGLTRTKAAEVLGVSVATVDNDWAFAKSWLKVTLSETPDNE